MALCEGRKLETTGNKADLIDRLVSLREPQYQRNPTRPQAIPLRTRKLNGEPLPHATDVLKRWRRDIFHGKDNSRLFSLINSKGESYQQMLRYATCSKRTLKVILENHWYMAHTSQRDLLKLLSLYPERFNLNIIQKPDSRGNSWLMIHTAPKAA